MIDLLIARKDRKQEVPRIPGTYWPEQGGYYAGLIRVGSDIYALVVAPKALGGEAPGELAWKTTQTSTAGTDSVNDGWANTQAMATAGLANHPAAQFCRGLTIGGYNDWYLPAKDELEILYRNFKPSTQSNNTSSGANSSSVPPQGDYTSGNPTQTSIALFKEGAAEAFQAYYHWSSTEQSSGNGWRQNFANGYQHNTNKTSAFYVRAVRRVKVEIPGPPASVGAPFEGGYYVGRIWQITGLYALVVAPKSLGGEQDNIRFRDTSIYYNIGLSTYDGYANTQELVQYGNSHPAAVFCAGLSIGGYTDWYLPSIDELEVCYRHLKPGTQANNVSTTGRPHIANGVNPYSLPVGDAYTSGNPSQTHLALFQTGGAEAFTGTTDAESRYWSSSAPANTLNIWCQRFDSGYQLTFDTSSRRQLARAVRRVHQPIYVAKN